MKKNKKELAPSKTDAKVLLVAGVGAAVDSEILIHKCSNCGWGCSCNDHPCSCDCMNEYKQEDDSFNGNVKMQNHINNYLKTKTTMKQKSQTQLQKEVDQFNFAYPVGSKVDVKQDSGTILHTEVLRPGHVLEGHSAVGYFEGIRGCYSLDRVVGHE